MRYIKDKNYVITSFVPKGKTNLVAENSKKFRVEEDSPAQSTAKKPKVEEIVVEKIPTSFDRTIEPPKGPDPLLNLPEVWKNQFDNGLKVYGIKHNELPLVQFSLTIRGGLLLDDINNVGTPNLITDVMMEGTKTKTPLEL